MNLTSVVNHTGEEACSHIFNIHTSENQIKHQLCDCRSQIKCAVDKHNSDDFTKAGFGSIVEILLIWSILVLLPICSFILMKLMHFNVPLSAFQNQQFD